MSIKKQKINRDLIPKEPILINQNPPMLKIIVLKKLHESSHNWSNRNFYREKIILSAKEWIEQTLLDISLGEIQESEKKYRENLFYTILSSNSLTENWFELEKEHLGLSCCGNCFRFGKWSTLVADFEKKSLVWLSNTKSCYKIVKTKNSVKEIEYHSYPFCSKKTCVNSKKCISLQNTLSVVFENFS